MNPIDELTEGKLLNMHTAFVGKVLAVSGNSATVQPLNLIKQYGAEPQKQAVIENVPILRHVKKITLYESQDRITVQSASVGDHGVHSHSVAVTGHGGHVRLSQIVPGDVVFCMCAERDISQVRGGNFALPALGHHQIQDAVVVGVL